jgi:predicted nucleic-acid-binding Zn-ribbon protein
MQDKSTTNDTCPNCGANEFERGWLHTSGTGRHVSYLRNDEGTGFLGTHGTEVTTRRCLSCGHLDLFAATDDK